MPRERRYLEDIRDAAALAIDHVGSLSAEDFELDPLKREAVLYRFIVIGEAVSRISDETQKRLISLPWREMRAMRNVLVHEYDQVQFDVVYKTVKENLPQLVTAIEAVLDEPWPEDPPQP
jgi:uncharacterized protein with HEPN domain